MIFFKINQLSASSMKHKKVCKMHISISQSTMWRLRIASSVQQTAWFVITNGTGKKQLFTFQRRNQQFFYCFIWKMMETIIKIVGDSFSLDWLVSYLINRAAPGTIHENMVSIFPFFQVQNGFNTSKYSPYLIVPSLPFFLCILLILQLLPLNEKLLCKVQLTFFLYCICEAVSTPL